MCPQISDIERGPKSLLSHNYSNSLTVILRLEVDVYYCVILTSQWGSNELVNFNTSKTQLV